MSCIPQKRISIQRKQKPKRTYVRLDILSFSLSVCGDFIQVFRNAG